MRIAYGAQRGGGSRQTGRAGRTPRGVEPPQSRIFPILNARPKINSDTIPSMDQTDVASAEPDFEAVCRQSLEWVESIFGEKDERVLIDSVVSSAEDRYPHTVYLDPDDHFIIGIVVPLVEEEWQLHQALTHEFVHALHPNGPPGGQATVLEEGLAEHSSVYFMRERYRCVGADGQEDPAIWVDRLPKDYREAFMLVEKLVASEGLDTMRSGIRALRRQTDLPFAQITADDLATVFDSTPRSLLEALSRRFHEGKSQQDRAIT